ncbi:MAG: hypothetical protein PHX28_00720 [Candidatus Omnitrophica bacterium]|nr:hypothetical protein [Candidatus Omnitrophota bacterium]
MMQILVALGLGIVIYAVFEIFSSGKNTPLKKKKHKDPDAVAEDLGKEQKIQRLQSQVAKLEEQLRKSGGASAGDPSDTESIKKKEEEFAEELKRRQEWVDRAEAELAKARASGSELSNKFSAKEKELEEEFTKNVNLTREIRELKASLEAKEMACRLKEDQLQSQKHQIESQLKNLGEVSARLAELERKEKISEWVPKLEFSRLNEEYTRLEKELEAAEEKIKNYAAEIVRLRQSAENKAFSGREAGPAEETSPVPEAAPLPEQQEKPAAEKLPETLPEEDKTTQDAAPPEEKQQNQERQNNEG